MGVQPNLNIGSVLRSCFCVVRQQNPYNQSLPKWLYNLLYLWEAHLWCPEINRSKQSCFMLNGSWHASCTVVWTVGISKPTMKFCHLWGGKRHCLTTAQQDAYVGNCMWRILGQIRDGVGWSSSVWTWSELALCRQRKWLVGHFNEDRMWSGQQLTKSNMDL